jgi:hypothetical protein
LRRKYGILAARSPEWVGQGAQAGAEKGDFAQGI